MMKTTEPQKRYSPLIALLTDFGLQDPYVAAMKGVILSHQPLARIVDFSHDIQPHKISQAGYILWSSYAYFPKKTIFVCVVDPGVGTERKILAVKTAAYTFLAPDNGLLDAVLSEERRCDVVTVTAEKVKNIISQTIAPTFHGRDVFAPIAAYLGGGIAIQKLGEKHDAPVFPSPFVHGIDDATKAAVLHIDRFGNIITNLRLGNAAKKIKAVSIATNLISRWVRTYSDAPENTPCLLTGSSGLVEISIKAKSAAALLSSTIGMPVRVYWQ